MRRLQADLPPHLWFKIFGDSAYFEDDVMSVGGGRGMASVREAIEWSYKDLKVLWKYCDYKDALQLRKQPVCKIFFVCMLLRNAHITMNGCQANPYFVMMPPTFEHWVSQGPDARPIPTNSTFSPNYRPEEDVIVEDDLEDSDSDED